MVLRYEFFLSVFSLSVIFWVIKGPEKLCVLGINMSVLLDHFYTRCQTNLVSDLIHMGFFTLLHKKW